MESNFFGNQISKFRKLNNLTQQQLADELHVSNKVVSKWENGQSEPDLFSLKKLSEIFKVSVDELVGDMPSTSKNANELSGGNNFQNKLQRFIKTYWLQLIQMILLVGGFLFAIIGFNLLTLPKWVTVLTNIMVVVLVLLQASLVLTNNNNTIERIFKFILLGTYSLVVVLSFILVFFILNFYITKFLIYEIIFNLILLIVLLLEIIFYKQKLNVKLPIKAEMKFAQLLMIMFIGGIMACSYANLTTVCVVSAKDIIEQKTPVGIYLNETTYSFTKPNASFQLVVKAYPETKIKNVKWSSLDNEIASVDKNGLVTSKSAGKTWIKAEAFGHTVLCAITVDDPESLLIAVRHYLDTNAQLNYSTEASIDLALENVATMYYNLGPLNDSQNASYDKLKVEFNSTSNNGADYVEISERLNEVSFKAMKIGSGTFKFTYPNGKFATLTINVLPLQSINCESVFATDYSSYQLSFNTTPYNLDVEKYADFEFEIENTGMCKNVLVVKGLYTYSFKFNLNIGVYGVTYVTIRDKISGVSKKIKVIYSDDYKPIMEVANENFKMDNDVAELAVRDINTTRGAVDYDNKTIRIDFSIQVLMTNKVIKENSSIPLTFYIHAFDEKNNHVKSLKVTFNLATHLTSSITSEQFSMLIPYDVKYLNFVLSEEEL